MLPSVWFYYFKSVGVLGWLHVTPTSGTWNLSDEMWRDPAQVESDLAGAKVPSAFLFGPAYMCMQYNLSMLYTIYFSSSLKK